VKNVSRTMFLLKGKTITDNLCIKYLFREYRHLSNDS
jgi:hypothetical protein